MLFAQPVAFRAASTALRISLRLPSPTSPSSRPFLLANLHAVAGIRPRLLATDIEFHGAINLISRSAVFVVTKFRRELISLRSGKARRVLEPHRLEVFEQAFLAALASVAAFPIAAETAGGVKQICANSPKQRRPSVAPKREVRH